MKRREIVLAAVFAALLFGYGGNRLFEAAIQGPLDSRHAAIERAKLRIDKLDAELERAREAGKELAALEAQSLPSDTGHARHLYQEWLTQLVNQIGLVDLNIGSSEPVNRKGSYEVLSFSIRGGGSLAQLVELLFHFYRADHLHQIQNLDIAPHPQTGELDLTIAIEALVLPGADRRDRLNTRTSNRLASRSLADYQSIVTRNLFHIGGSGPDATDHTFLTAVIDVDGQFEAWFTLRATDKMLKLHKGESLEVGPFRGTIVEIEDSDVVIEADDERWLLSVGENLAQATSLPPEY